MPNGRLQGFARINQGLADFSGFQNFESTATGVKQVGLRSDTAGYQHDLLKCCATEENSRFGAIKFAIGCNVTKEFRQAVMKDDLAGGKLPSDDFGENAAWWWIMILAHNLNAMMKRFSINWQYFHNAIVSFGSFFENF